MREQETQKEILDWLTANGILHWKNHIGGVKVRGARIRNAMKGFPDIAGVMPGTEGRMFVIEVKQDAGRFSMEQVGWMTRLKSAGVWYIIATSLTDVVSELKT